MSAESQDKTRRGFLKRSVAGGITAGASVAGLLPQIADAQARGDATLDRLQKARKILLKGGIVMSLDPAVGDFAKADVLIEGKKIAAYTSYRNNCPFSPFASRNG